MHREEVVMQTAAGSAVANLIVDLVASFLSFDQLYPENDPMVASSLT